MNPMTNVCDQIVAAPAAGNTAATTTAFIDTLGYDYAQVLITLGTGASTEHTFDALSVGEADTAEATEVSSIAALIGSTATAGDSGFVIPKNLTATGSMIRLNVDTRGRKRFLYLSATPGTNNVWGASLRLSRGAVEPPPATSEDVTRNVAV